MLTSRTKEPCEENTMTSFHIKPIPSEIASEVRRTRRSPGYGHPVHLELASGYGPCRACLRTFAVGKENRLLFTYNPFSGVDPYPSPGPVFVHEEDCGSFDSESVFPTDLRALPLVLEGYGRERWIVARERPAADEIEAAIGRLFANQAIEYIHIRNGEAGCFIASVDRLV
jgi:hypothetical protein